ncbi:accessory Sec system glycosyltransferase Asp1 [Lactococcus nasutitermitis]|uniref:Accessory Sec system glycosyltransferase Asp1 n=1 Tax=Lactococcus nasutitermitis TaxID=1652957 RepID=A0ABV9J9M8_9LACT|nr:accessory Sec system glycosyltransferase Asp1 [Lactococcus nasutitermitis]
MNYFVNENIFTLNSGTEFSAIKRLKMFHDYGVDAKILTRNYNPQLAGDLRRVGLSHKDIINMYNYFQEITNTEEKDVDVRYTSVIDKNAYHIEGVDANESLIKHAGRVIAKVNIASATVGLVGSMDYYNDMGAMVAKDIWDRRGFKSSTQYFHPDNTLGAQVFFDYQGKAKIEITHMNINGVLNPTMYKLLDYKGKKYRFNTEQELFIFFMNELAVQAPSIFINDRPSLVPAVAAINGAVGKWQFLHNPHGKNNNQAGGSRQVVDYQEPLFTTYKDKFDGIIVPTEKQKSEIGKYFKFKHILALPDTFSEEVKTPEKITHDRNKIIYLGRISGEKKPADVIEIFAKAYQKIPTLKLEILGYASPYELQKELEKLTETLGVKEAVNFKGYQTDENLTTEISNAGFLINTSEGEAFGMNMLEAMSYGVPIISYKVKYGPLELIDEGKNGYLVSYGAIDMAANKLVDTIQSEEKWKELSHGAYEKAQEFSKESSWGRWLNNKVIADNLFVRDK